MSEKLEDYGLPSPNILKEYTLSAMPDKDEIKQQVQDIFIAQGISADLLFVDQTPLSITFAIRPDEGVRVKDITSCEQDITMKLGSRIDFEIPLKGTSYLGLNIYNSDKNSICLRQAVTSAAFQNSEAKIPLLLGMQSAGTFFVDDLDDVGHLLIGGDTGSGKSVLLNCIILGILFKKNSNELKLLLIDTNIVDLNAYSGIPSLVTPVITDVNRALGAINWLCLEIRRRNMELMERGLKDIDDYNTKYGNYFAHIVAVIDGIAPILEENGMDQILSIASAGKRAGVHLIISTQMNLQKIRFRRLTEAINAKIAMRMFNEADSKMLIDDKRASYLTDIGEMLYRRPGNPTLFDIQGIEISDQDIEAVTAHLRLTDDSMMIEDISKSLEKAALDIKDYSASSNSYMSEEVDEDLFLSAAEFAVNLDKETISSGLIQRKFRLGFNKAARIMDLLAEDGIVGEEMGTKGRRIIMTPEQFEEYKQDIGY